MLLVLNSRALHDKMNEFLGLFLEGKPLLNREAEITWESCFPESTVDSHYLDFGYLELPLISKRKSDLCFNIDI